jgi:serine/threonine protein kinase
MSLPRPFGPYTLLRRLAVGGMAEIYVAKTRGLGGFEKLVAIKLVHPHLSADAHFVRMLIDEAKILVLLTHANVAQVFDLGCLDGTYYIAMEFVEGVDIFGLQKAAAKVKRPLPIPVCCFIVAEMLNGLDYAHRKRDPEGKPLNIVHRDISPQNVLISQAGEVKLVDFGIAKTNLRGEGTEVGVIKGKYYYMSPEQAWADPMDRRSDLFSTGIVLYEMLTGRMLYGAASIPELISKVREAEIEPPETLRPDIPPALSAVVMKALQREQRARYQSALDMGEALRDFMYESAPQFNAGRLAHFVAELLEEESKLVEPGRNSDTTGRLRALTREEFVRTGNSVIFKLNELAQATRADLPAKARRQSSAEMKAAPEPPPKAAPVVQADSASGSLPAAAGSAMPLPKLRVPLPPVSKVPPAPRRAGRFAEQTLDSAPPTEVMSRPPELRKVSVWPHESTRPSEPPQDDPTEMWQSPFKPANDDGETLIDADVGIGFANTEMLMRAHVLEATRYAQGANGTGGHDEMPTSKYTAANANAMRAGVMGRPWPSVPPASVATTTSGKPALVPPPGEMNSIGPIPPSPPIPDFGPHDGLFRGADKPRPWTQITIAVLFMVLGMVAFQLLRAKKPEPQLEIVSVPAGAKVSVDHRKQEGATPLRITGLESGRKYDLRVELAGYVPWEATYHASPGAVRHIAVLKPITGEVHVASEPSGANVWLDGVAIGKTPLTISSITVGRKVRLRVGHPGFVDQRRELMIDEKNLRTTLKIPLAKAP